MKTSEAEAGGNRVAELLYGTCMVALCSASQVEVPAPRPKLALRPKSVSRLAPTNANEGANASRRSPPKPRKPTPILSCAGLHLLSHPS